MLAHCTARGIGFIPWYPLRAGALARSDSLLIEFSARHGATPAQVALAYLLHLSPVTLPIPGTSKLVHLEENAAATALFLGEEEMEELARLRNPSGVVEGHARRQSETALDLHGPLFGRD